MKKKINGRKYDTCTAKILSFYESDAIDSCRHYFEGVYMKRNGEYFFAARGGAATVYSDSINGVLTQGAVIVPLRSKADAEKISAILEGNPDESCYNLPGFDPVGQYFYWKPYVYEVYWDMDIEKFYVG